MPRSVKVRLNNPALLRWARQSAGYGAEEIATHLKKPVAAIRAWEEGKAAPTYRQLQRFASKVHRPVAALFLPEVPEEPSPPEDFRVLAGEARGTFAPATLLAFRALRNSMRELRGLLTDLGEPLALTLPTWDGADTDAILTRATHLRDLLGITFEAQLKWGDAVEALNQWRDALFERGVLVQIFRAPLEDMRAFSLLDYQLAGVGLNANDARSARIFSLFHEVAHLTIGKPGVSGEMVGALPLGEPEIAGVERYCDAFAAAFLLPHSHPAVTRAMEELKSEFTMALATRYAGSLKVSKYVLARRVLDMGEIEPEAYWREIKSWRDLDRESAAPSDARKGGPDYLRVQVSRAGKRYVAKVMEGLDRGVLTAYEAGKILGINPHRVADAQLLVT